MVRDLKMKLAQATQVRACQSVGAYGRSVHTAGAYGQCIRGLQHTGTGRGVGEVWGQVARMRLWGLPPILLYIGWLRIKERSLVYILWSEVGSYALLRGLLLPQE